MTNVASTAENGPDERRRAGAVSRFRNWKLIAWELLAAGVCVLATLPSASKSIWAIGFAGAAVFLALTTNEARGVTIGDDRVSTPKRGRGTLSLFSFGRQVVPLAEIDQVALLPSRLGFKRVQLISRLGNQSVVVFPNPVERRRFIDTLQARRPSIDFFRT
jgi:hypothetical protein